MVVKSPNGWFVAWDELIISCRLLGFVLKIAKPVHDAPQHLGVVHNLDRLNAFRHWLTGTARQQVRYFLGLIE
jgi:hypothetical protein